MAFTWWYVLSGWTFCQENVALLELLMIQEVQWVPAHPGAVEPSRGRSELSARRWVR